MASQVLLRVRAVRCLCQAAHTSNQGERDRLIELASQLELQAQVTLIGEPDIISERVPSLLLALDGGRRSRAPFDRPTALPAAVPL